MPLQVSKRKVFYALLAFEAAWVSLYWITARYLTDVSWTFSRWFDLDEEGTVAAWFSSAQLFTLFLLCFFYALRQSDLFLRRFYFLLGSVLFFFSADETAQIHEGLNHILKKVSDHSAIPNLDGTWVFAYLFAFLLATAVFWRDVVSFLKDERGRNALLLGAFIFGAGAAGIEVLGYMLTMDHSVGNVRYLIEVSLEESFEMIGQSIMIYAMMCKIDSLHPFFEQETN